MVQRSGHQADQRLDDDGNQGQQDNEGDCLDQIMGDGG
jgi:hypothetical protein